MAEISGVKLGVKVGVGEAAPSFELAPTKALGLAWGVQVGGRGNAVEIWVGVETGLGVGGTGVRVGVSGLWQATKSKTSPKQK